MTADTSIFSLYLAAPDEWARGARREWALGLLSAEERERYDRFRFAPPARAFLTGRALVRQALALHGSTAAADWQLEADEHGRPRIVGPPGSPELEFNLTHNDDLVACMVAAHGTFGVDVEDLGRRVEALRIAEHSFSEEEVEDLRRLDGDALAARFFAYWTLKEAYLKARGRGIAMRLDSVVFRFEPNATIGVSFASRIDDRPEDWYFALYQPAGRQRLAVALRTDNGSRLEIRAFRALPEHLRSAEMILEPLAETGQRGG